MQHANLIPLDSDEYLAQERLSDRKHEYVAGQVYAMVGTTDRHNLIAGNLYMALRAKLRGGSCRVFMSDVKVEVEAANTFYYPDLFVTCDARDQDAYVKRYPCLVIEVLSSSTEGIDRREKLLNYRRLDSLREYVLVASDMRRIEVYRRVEEGGWTVDTLGTSEVVEFNSVGISLPVAEVYADVTLEMK